MPLIEQLMGLEAPKVKVHTFFAANHERLEGRQTRAEVVAACGINPTSEAEYDALVVLAPTGTTALATAQKAMYLNRIHATFMLAENGAPGYATHRRL